MKKKKFSKKEISGSGVVKKSRFNKKSILVAMIGIGIISIMVGSALNLWSASERGRYKEYKFVKEEGFSDEWKSYINGRYYSFDFLPGELEDFSIDFSINTNQVYILYDPEETEIEDRVFNIKILFNELGRVAFPTCIKEEGCGDFPVYDCSEIDKGIYLIDSNENKIYEKDNCLVIDGDYEHYLKSINYLKYKMLGVL